MRQILAGCLAAALLLTTSVHAASAADPEYRREATRGEPRPDRDRVGADERGAADGSFEIQTAPGANGKIVYSRAPFLEWPADTWVMNGDGSGEALLKAGGIGQGDTYPAWSPGGTMIAFTRDTTSATDDAAGDIYVMRQDGNQVTRLTATSAAEFDPSWSPDGSRIAFSSNRAGNYEIYTMNVDGTDVRRITTNAADDFEPSWSPDGTRIAFLSFRSGNGDIYTMGPTGASVARITTNDALDISPNWSPNGDRIAFTSDRTGDFDVFTMNTNGSSVVNVTSDPGSWDFNPSWSPDGSLIVYDADPFGDLDVYVVPAAGGTSGPLAEELDDEWNPDWQPIPAFPLVDARFSPFDADIQWVFGAGITTGCSSERYCPDNSVTREQMASFLARALSLPTTTNDYFTDDETSPHEADINRVREAGITTGCTATTYCPTAVVTRAQMASFLARALGLPTTTNDYFTDDETNPHEADINRVREAGITTGCTATTYCPAAVVTRGQMAAFLHRALD